MRPSEAAAEAELSLDEVAPLESAPLEETPLSLPSGDFTSEPIAELRTVGSVVERGETFNVVQAEGGLLRAELHGGPVNWLSDGEWLPIDQTLVQVDGRWQNASGPVVVSFGPTGGTRTVRLEAADGSWSASFGLPGLTPGIEPDINGNVARYRNVLPGVDMVQTLTATHLKEQFIVATPAAAALLSVAGALRSSMTLVGVTARDASAGGIELVRNADEVVVTLPPGVAEDSSGDGLTIPPQSTPVAVRLGDALGSPVINVEVDASWLLNPNLEYPLIVDPTAILGEANGGVDSFNYSQDPYKNTSYDGFAQLSDGWYVDKVSTGVHMSFLKYDISPIVGRPVALAQWVGVPVLVDGSGEYRLVPIGDPWTPGSATWNGAPQPLVEQPSGTTPQVLQEADPGVHNFVDITSWVGNWSSGAWANNGLRLDAQHVGFSHVRFASMEAWTDGDSFDPHISVLYTGNPPNSPHSPSPGNDTVVSTTTPTLSAQPAATPHPDGKPVKYEYIITTDPAVAGGQVATSGLLPSLSPWTVPAGVLRDGTTYYWTVRSSDGAQTANMAAAKVQVNLRLGASGPSPTDSFGPATVNLTNGNLVVSTSSPTVNTLGGPVGLTYTYNSKAAKQSGLRAEYFDHCNPNLPLATPDVVRSDTSLSFNWNGASPAAGIGGKDFCARWTGNITVPRTNTYCLDLASDDGVRVWVDGVLWVDRWDEGSWSSPQFPTCRTLESRSNSIKVEYYQRQAGSFAHLYVSGPEVGTILVPSDWLTESPLSLPTGWSTPAPLGEDLTYSQLKSTPSGVTLTSTDGQSFEYKMGADGRSFAKPANDDSVVSLGLDAENRVTYVVQASDGITYTFNHAGQLASAVTDTDVGGASTAPVYSYDTDSGRLGSIKDPVGNRTLLSMTYSISNGSNPCPVDSGFATPPNGMLCRITYLGSADETRLLYNANGQLVRIVDPGDEVTDFSYNASGLLQNVRDPLAFDMVMSGARANDATTYTSIAYANGKVDSVTLPAPTAGAARPQHYYRYTGGLPGSGSTDVHDPSIAPEGVRYLKRAGFDSLGRATFVTDTAGLTTTSTWLANTDLPVTVTSPGGRTVTTEYDESERPKRVLGPGPEVSTTSYDQDVNGNTLKGLAAQWWPNSLQRGAPTVRSLGVGDPNGALLANWGGGSPHGLPAESFAARFTGKVRSQAGGSYIFRLFSDDGVRVFVNDKLILDSWVAGTAAANRDSDPIALAADTWYRIRVDYFESGGAASINLAWVAPGQSQATIPGDRLRPEYGLATTTTELEEVNGSQTTVTSRSEYENPADGLLTATVEDATGTNPLETRTSYEPSGRRRRSARTLPKGNATTYDYYLDTETPTGAASSQCSQASGTQAGMLKSAVQPDPGAGGSAVRIINQYAYDRYGRVAASRTTADTQWACTEYDNRGRVTRQVDREGSETVLTYNKAGSTRVDYDDSNGDSRFTIETFDMLGRTTEYRDEWGTITRRAYDNAGRPTTTSRKLYDAPSFSNLTTTGYDAATLRPATFTDHLNGNTTSTIEYDAAGRAYKVNRANGVSSTTTYVPNTDRVANISNTFGSTELSPWSYTYTAGGKVKTETTTGRSRTYRYDGPGRLTTTIENGQTTTYSYDANTNRRCTSDTPCGTTDPYRYDNADRLLSSPFAAYTYDPHGNMVSAVDPAPLSVPINQTADYDAVAGTGGTVVTLDDVIAGNSITANLSTTPQPSFVSATSNGTLAAGASTTIPLQIYGVTYVKSAIGVPAAASFTAALKNPAGTTTIASQTATGAFEFSALTPAAAGVYSLVLTNNSASSAAWTSTHSTTTATSTPVTSTAALAPGATAAAIPVNAGAGGVIAADLTFPQGSVTVNDPAINDTLGILGTDTHSIDATGSGPITANADWTAVPTYSTEQATGSIAAGTRRFQPVPARGSSLIRFTATPPAGSTVTILLKDAGGAVVAFDTGCCNLGFEYRHTANTPAIFSAETVNQGASAISVPSTWESTSYVAGSATSTGTLAPGAATSHTVTSDGQGQVFGDLTYPRGTKAVTDPVVNDNVGIVGADNRTISATGAGAITASVDWAANPTWSSAEANGNLAPGTPRTQNVPARGRSVIRVSAVAPAGSNIAINLKDPTGAVVATATGCCTPLLEYVHTSSTPATFTAETVNQAASTVSVKSTWETTSVRAGTGSGAAPVAPGATSANVAVTADGKGQLVGTVTYPMGTHNVDQTTDGHVNKNAATTTNLNVTGTGTLTADLGWSADRDTTTVSGSLTGNVHTDLVDAVDELLPPDPTRSHTVNVSANGNLNATLTWPEGAIEQLTPNFKLELLDPSGTVVATADRSSGDTETISRSVTGAFGAARSYQLRVTNKTPLQSNYQLTIAYPVTANLDAELLDPAGTVVASAANTASARPETLSYTVEAGQQGIYKLRTISRNFPADFTVNASIPTAAHAAITARVKTATGTVLASSSSSDGSVTVSGLAPSAGAYAFDVVNNSPDITVPGFAVSSERPVVTTANLDLELRNPSGVVVAQTTSTTAKPESLTYNVAENATGVYQLRIVSRDHDAAYSLTGGHVESGFASVAFRLKNAGGTLIASSASSNGTAAVSGLVPSAGAYTLEVANTSTDYPVPSYLITHGRPQQRTANIDLQLVNPSAQVVAQTTSTTAKPETLSYNVPANATGTYQLRVISRDYDVAYTANTTHVDTAYGTMTATLKNAGGTAVKTVSSATGSLHLDHTVANAGAYSLELRNSGPTFPIPSYTGTTAVPTQRSGTLSMVLKKAPNTTVASANGTNPTINYPVTASGEYTLTVTPLTGSGTWTLTGATTVSNHTTVNYDGKDRAKSLHTATTDTFETLSASGRVIRRRVFDKQSGTYTEDTIFGYDNGGDSPSWSRDTTTTTTFLGGGTLSAIYTTTGTTTTGKWPITSAHGDIAGYTNSTGAFTPIAMTDEWGNGPTNSDRLGWLGSQQRRTIDQGGIIRMGVRLYDPRIGRFLQVDSIEGGSCNDYDYVCGDPINSLDLDGLKKCSRWDVVCKAKKLPGLVKKHRDGLATVLAVGGMFGCVVCTAASVGLSAWSAYDSCKARDAVGCGVGVASLAIGGLGSGFSAAGKRLAAAGRGRLAASRIHAFRRHVSGPLLSSMGRSLMTGGKRLGGLATSLTAGGAARTYHSYANN